MSEFREGGYNKIDLFMLVENGTADGYDFKAIDGTTAATDYTDALITLDRTMGETVALDDAGLPTLDLEQEVDDSAYETVMKVLAPPSPTGTSAEVIYVDGVKRGGTIGNGPLVLAIGYGAIDGSDKRFVYAITGRVSPSGRGFQTKSGESSKPPFKLTGEALKYDCELKTLLRTTLVTAPSAMEMPVGHGLLKVWLTPAA